MVLDLWYAGIARSRNVTIQGSFSRRLRQPLKKKGMVRGHLALRQGDCVPLLKSYLVIATVPAGRRLGLDQFVTPHLQAAASSNRLARFLSWFA
jgi:hypothetical protein